MIATYPLPIYVQRFFTERLLTQMQASPNTIASYRDTFRGSVPAECGIVR